MNKNDRKMHSVNCEMQENAQNYEKMHQNDFKKCLKLRRNACKMHKNNFKT